VEEGGDESNGVAQADLAPSAPPEDGGAVEQDDALDLGLAAGLEQAERASRVGLADRMEDLGIDAARDDPELRRRRGVELLELGGLDLARRDDRRGFLDRATLDRDTHVTLRVHVLVHDLALHEPERVEHLDPRHSPLWAEHPRDLRRQPVMRVDDVIAQVVLRDIRLDARGELGESVIHLHLREVAHRT